MSHTKDPWAVGYGGQPGDGYFTIISGGKVICDSAPRSDIDDAELCAIARLIANAPRLLAELIYALDVAEMRLLLADEWQARVRKLIEESK